MRLIPALGLPGEATPPRRLRFAADFDVLRLALVRLVERFEERLRFDLLGTGGMVAWGNSAEMRRASRTDED
jgi:hypothetical protein